MDRIMTLPQVAKYLQMSKDTIYKMAQKGLLPGSKLGGSWRFKQSRIDTWVDKMENTKTAKRKRRSL